MRELDKKKSFILLLIMCMGIGFSFLTSTLTITGNTSVSGNKWDIYFDNIQVSEGSVQASTPIITNKTTVNYSVTFEKPGDYFEFTVDAVNGGTINAMIDSIVKTEITGEAANFIKYTTTYNDGGEISQNDILDAEDTVTYKVFLAYSRDIEEEDLLESDFDLNLSFSVNYIQTSLSNTKIVYGKVWNFDYTGGEQTLNIPFDGNYKLEVWGASGGVGSENSGVSQYPGYGGYSVGNIVLSSGNTIYINVGGKGTDGVLYGCSVNTAYGGYNGGGNSANYCAGGGGGGATHIATASGVLSRLSSNI